ARGGTDRPGRPADRRTGGGVMFTGIVEELGSVVDVRSDPDRARLTVRGAVVLADVRRGDSIAVSGVCLTVVEVQDDTFSADVMRETLDRSALGALRPG